MVSLTGFAPVAARHLLPSLLIDAQRLDLPSLEFLARDATAAGQFARVSGNDDDADDLFTLADVARQELDRHD